MKLKRLWIMIIALATAFCMLFCFAACGETGGEDANQSGGGNNGGGDDGGFDDGSGGLGGGGGGLTKPGQSSGSSASEVLKDIHEHYPGSWVKISDPTCTEMGLMEYQGCATCAELLEKDETYEIPTRVLAALGHDLENGACKRCPQTFTESEGLSFELTEDKSSYIAVGFGTFDGTELVIPASYKGKPVTEIGRLAFGAMHDTELETKTSAEKAAENAKRAKIAKITTLVIPDSITKIGSQAFRGYSKLTSINLPSSGSIEFAHYVFAGCTGLESVTIPASVKGLEGAFMECSRLKSVSLPEGLTKIDSFAFDHCTSLVYINIPDSVTAIDSYGFHFCKSLKSIELPHGLQSIGTAGFYLCEIMHEIHYDGTIEEWRAISKDGPWDQNTNDLNQLVTRPMKIFCTNGTY